MIQTNPRVKEKWPYFWANLEEQEERQRIDRLVEEAEIKINQYAELKMSEIEEKLKMLENSIAQTRFNIETSINNMPVNSGAIKRELNNIVINEVRKAVK